MTQKYLLYILVILTFLQSVDAVADAAKFHQPNSEYAEADYFPNKIFTSETSVLENNNSRKNSDVDHCCSCHGVTSMLFLSKELFSYVTVLQNEITSFNTYYLSHLISPDIRPPIV